MKYEATFKFQVELLSYLFDKDHCIVFQQFVYKNIPSS